MSLTAAEIERTREELRANLALSGLDVPTLAARLGMSAARTQTALDVSGAPTEAWFVRDYLVNAVRAAGAEPVPFTVLTDDARTLAQNWFPLRRAPSC
jgi:hypothetical protein